VSVKTILVAHQLPAIRDRFAAALAEARHASVTAPSESRVRAILAERPVRIDLALVDLGIPDAPMDLVADVRRSGERLVPVVVFAGSLISAAQVIDRRRSA
jgi:DNA-binding response OmpR family regulator